MSRENTERVQDDLFRVVRIVPLKIDLSFEMRIGNPDLALARSTSTLSFLLCRRCLGYDNLRRSNLQSLCQNIHIKFRTIRRETIPDASCFKRSTSLGTLSECHKSRNSGGTVNHED